MKENQEFPQSSKFIIDNNVWSKLWKEMHKQQQTPKKKREKDPHSSLQLWEDSASLQTEGNSPSFLVNYKGGVQKKKKKTGDHFTRGWKINV